ncbi:MAG: cytochrome b [Rhodocyclaceae bacterium]|jgi:cytochrome b561|nr:cytochrome b [Rhodocyclaceae bacterium]MCO5098997.1 cytochrome b [Rhodocyclaceae bacterium]MCZ7654734.1 cytochrome b [Rhodocyclaceae bacterium]
MSLKNNANSYGAVSRALHWGIAILAIAAIAFVEIHEIFPKGSEPREGAKLLHVQLGMLVFGLTWLRLAWRAANPPPAITPAPQAWEARLATLMHVALYASMLALPVLGVAMGQASGKTVAFLGSPLPVFLAENKALGKTLKEAHELIGNLAIGLIAFHALAALWHHYFKRDDTLARMLPAWLALRLRVRAR